jgi:Fur family ferric uptake transcriptional regulator
MGTLGKKPAWTLDGSASEEEEGLRTPVKAGAVKPTHARGARTPDLNRLRTDLDAFMLRRGLRSTEQRRLIIDTLFTATEHVTIDRLLEQVRATDPKVGYATVYRTLKMLTESGVAQEHHFGDGHTRYELADSESHHDHLICVECGSITEFEEPAVEALQDRIASRHGFEIRAHKHELYGVCAECQRKRPKRK